MMRSCYEHNCLAVIWQTEGGNVNAGSGALCGIKGFVSRSDYLVPLVEITEKDANIMLENLKLARQYNQSLIISLSPNDVNLYTEAYQTAGFIIIRILLALFGVVCIVLCLQRLYSYCLYDKSKRLAIWCLIIELLANIMRVTFFAVDPLCMNSIFTLHITRVLFTLPTVLGFISSLMLTFVWKSLTDKESFLFASISPLKWPFIVLSCVLLGSELTLDIVTAYDHVL